MEILNLAITHALYSVYWAFILALRNRSWRDYLTQVLALGGLSAVVQCNIVPAHMQPWVLFIHLSIGVLTSIVMLWEACDWSDEFENNATQVGNPMLNIVDSLNPQGKEKTILGRIDDAKETNNCNEVFLEALYKRNKAFVDEHAEIKSRFFFETMACRRANNTKYRTVVGNGGRRFESVNLREVNWLK